MSLDKLEIWVHDHILKNDALRHFAYGMYQRMLYMISPKILFEGEVKKITPDDGYEYLFGYYDKCPWSYDGNFVLALRVKDATKSPDSCEPAEIVTVDVRTKAVETLAVTHSWNVQQGCMAQWMSKDEILYNDCRDEKYCAIVLNIKTKEERIINMPVYAMSQDKKTALSLDFSRLHRLRPGYGYANIPEFTKEQRCPDAPCIWKIDIATGEITPLLKYTDFASFEQKESMVGAEHKVNHLMISPNGNRFMVLHRWFQNGVKYTRLVTCNMDGTDMYNLSDDDFVSHCCWKNDHEILSYLNKKDGGKGYYLMKDKSHEYERKWPELVMDGHPTYSPDGRCIVTDTYPNRRRVQTVYIASDNGVNRIARVFSPFKYKGDVRCDLHPRWGNDGRRICFDGAFEGKRGMCEIKLSNEDVYSPQIMGNHETTVSVVMTTYNGEKYLREQIESVLRQKGVNVRLLVRDDGSNDGTCQILDEYQNRNYLRWYKSGHLGVQKGFLDLLKHTDDSEYYAFCDQDDVWDDDKLLYAVASLEKIENKNVPQLYYCGLRLVDENVNYLSTHRIATNRSTHANYYISNVAGCTCVFNKCLRNALNKRTPDFVLMHDSWAYKVCISLGGVAVADANAHISYRQHQSNVVGMKKKGRFSGVKRYLNDFKIQEQMKNLLTCYGDDMTPEYKALTNKFVKYDTSIMNWMQLLFHRDFDFKSLGLNGLSRIKILLRKV